MLPPHHELWSIRTTPKSSQHSLVQRLMFKIMLWWSNDLQEGLGCRNALAPELALRVTGSELHITGICKYTRVHLFKYCSTNLIVKRNSNLHFLPNQHKIPQNALWLFCGSPSPYPFFLTSVTIAIGQSISSYWICFWLWWMRASLPAICVMTGSIKYTSAEAPQLSICCCSPFWRQHQKIVKLSTNCKLEFLTVIQISNITRETFWQINMYEPQKNQIRE